MFAGRIFTSTVVIFVLAVFGPAMFAGRKYTAAIMIFSSFIFLTTVVARGEVAIAFFMRTEICFTIRTKINRMIHVLAEFFITYETPIFPTAAIFSGFMRLMLAVL